MALSFRLRRHAPITAEEIERGVEVALHPDRLALQPAPLRKHIEEVAKAVTMAPGSWNVPPGQARRKGPQPIDVRTLAARAAAQLAPSSSVTPEDIQLALHRQGVDWVEPFAPGMPLVPYYGYGRRPRMYDYMVGRNVTTETRPDRIPFQQLKQVVEGYDIALSCIRYTINDLRSMELKWGPMAGYEGDTKRDALQAAQLWRRPDGKRFFGDWLAQAMMDQLRYDASSLYRERNAAGKMLALKIIDGTTLAPMLDYFGELPEPPAPAFQQFIQGVPWDWLTTDDILYSPMWPVPESPFGVPPIETVLLNANTDVRLQLFFLEFFTAGAVPEMFALAPPDQSDPDALAEWEEVSNDRLMANQAARHGMMWLPGGTELKPYKQIEQIDPKIAEYVIRRTVAAFGLTPQNLGILDDVNRATSETQVDQQFRVGTLPHVRHWEAIINSVTQEDYGLPVAAHFDTGREAEDRLMEAQAHQIWVSIGAESTDEVRDQILGLPIDNENPVPRGYFSAKGAFVPIHQLQALAGPVDPETYSPTDAPAAPVWAQTISGFGPAAPQEMALGPQDIHRQVGSEHAGAPVDPMDAQYQSAATETADKPAGYGLAGLERNAGRSGKSLDLAKWQRQSRDRLRRGKRPRQFADSAIDQRTHDAVWDRLCKATSQDEVDSAFRAGLQDAAAAQIGLRGPEPLPESAGGQPDPKDRERRPGPWGYLEAALVAFYEPLVLAGLMASVPSLAATQAWFREWAKTPGLPADSDAAQDVARAFAATSMPLDKGPLGDTIERIYRDSWLPGAQDAVAQLGARADRSIPLVQAVDETDWPQWVPGNPPGVADLRSLDFDPMGAEVGSWLKEMDATTCRQIAEILHDGVESGDGVNVIAAKIDQHLHNPSRARMVAVTEVNRAMSRSAFTIYKAHGVPMWDLVTQVGACPICLAVKAHNPHPMTDITERPPLHPRCRCVPAPAYPPVRATATPMGGL